MATTRKATAATFLPLKHDDASNNNNNMRYNRVAASRSSSRTTSVLSAAASLGIVVRVFFVMWEASTPRQAPLIAPTPPGAAGRAAPPATGAMLRKAPPPPDPYQTDERGCYHAVPTDDPSPHIVSPPPGAVTLVCCQTTLGIHAADPNAAGGSSSVGAVLNIAVHPTWAPLGAQRFLDMVENKFFASEVRVCRAWMTCLSLTSRHPNRPVDVPRPLIQVRVGHAWKSLFPHIQMPQSPPPYSVPCFVF